MSSVKLKSLTATHRAEAAQSAKRIIIERAGNPPTLRDYEGSAYSKYPAYVTKIITGLSMLMLSAAFSASAIRLYHIGSITFGHSIADERSMIVAGLAYVMLAEIGLIIFSLALAVMDNNRSAKFVLYGSITLSASIALVGNIEVALPGQVSSPTAWLEAAAPPLLALGTSFVLKGQILLSIENRHESQKLFSEAQDRYQVAIDRPTSDPDYQRVYANTLRDALTDINSRGQGKADRKVLLEALTVVDWRQMVWAEMKADTWFEEPVAQIIEPSAPSVPEESIPTTAETRVCPGCEEEFTPTRPDAETCSPACRKRVSRAKSSSS